MVTDQELASGVETLLRQAAPAVSASNISVPNLIRHLEAHFGLDLSHKESFIRNQVALLLAPQIQKDRFAPTFQPFQYHHFSNLAISAAAAAASGSPYQGQQEFSFKYQGAPEMVGGAASPSATSVKATAEPLREDAKPAAVFVAGTKESAPTPTKRKGGPGGLNKVCGVSPLLQAIVGQPTMARTEIVKQLWAYIRKNNLQDPNNKRKIICNDELRLLFETDCTDMFIMNKLLSKHIISLNEPSREVEPDLSKKEVEPEAKRLKAALSADVVSFGSTGIDKCPIMISDALAQFLGTGEKKMLHAEALGRVWDHIKSNHLEDPRNAMVILCDSKLKQLFGCESVSALGISELLSRHCFVLS